MKFEDLPINAQTAAFEAFNALVVKETVLVSDEHKLEQKARIENLAESLAAGFIKLYQS